MRGDVLPLPHLSDYAWKALTWLLACHNGALGRRQPTHNWIPGTSTVKQPHILLYMHTSICSHMQEHTQTRKWRMKRQNLSESTLVNFYSMKLMASLKFKLNVWASLHTANIKSHQLLQPLCCLWKYSNIKKLGVCPLGLEFSYIKLETISGKLSAQLNFWNSTDCEPYEDRIMNDAYVTDSCLYMKIHVAHRVDFHVYYIQSIYQINVPAHNSLKV